MRHLGSHPIPSPAAGAAPRPVRRGVLVAPKRCPRKTATTASSATAAGGGGALAAAAEVLRKRLRAGLDAELQAERAAVLGSYGRSSERALAEEGLILVGLLAIPAGRLYSDFIWQLSAPAGAALPFHKFQPGDNVLLRPSPPSRGAQRQRPEGGEEEASLTGVVLETQKAHLLVTLSKQNSDRISGHAPGTRYRVDKGAEETSWRRQMDALERLSEFHNPDCRGERLVRAVLLGAKQAQQLAAEPPEWMRQRKWVEGVKAALASVEYINLSQRTAIAAALTRSVTLWQGPPGTGKTRTLIALMEVLCLASGATLERQEELGPILGVADTNAAADNILAGLLERGVSVVRMGRPAKVRPELQHACLEAQAERTKLGEKARSLRNLAGESLQRAWEAKRAGAIDDSQLKQMQARSDIAWGEADALISRAATDILGQAQVVVCTCNGAGDARLQQMHFRVVVLDEASQATEASTLVPLVKGAECVVAAGDPNQLPPTVLSQEALRYQLDQPLFTRLAGSGLNMLLLDTQYRMHPMLAEFPSNQFYSGSIKSGVTGLQRPLVKGIRWPSVDCPVLFIDCEEGHEQRAHVNARAGHSSPGAGASYKNTTEADLAVQALAQVLREDPGVATIALLTPYNGQVRLLQAMVGSAGLADPGGGRSVTVSSVDGYQGREADLVIFSAVRSNAEGRLGFLADARRLNVALTRPRRGLVVIGSAATLRSDPNWRAFLAWWRSQANPKLNK